MSVNPTENKIVVNSPETWEFARQVALVIGKLPSSFTSSIRSLRTNAEENRKNGSEGYGPGARFVAGRILKGPSMLAPFYFYLRTYHEEKLSGVSKASVDSLLRLVSPDEAAAIIAAVYLTRKVKKFSTPELWDSIAPTMLAECEMGAFVGHAITRVGPGDGLLMGIGRYCGKLILNKSNARSEKEYRRHLKSSKVDVDLKKETELFGCTHLQVASIVFQSMGFGISYAYSFTNGLTEKNVANLESDPDAQRIKTVDIWVQEMLKTASEPIMNHKANLYPDRDKLDLLVANAKGYIDEGSAHRWLFRTKEEVTAETAPELALGDYKKQAEPVAPPEATSASPLPEDVSEEELQEISAE